ARIVLVAGGEGQPRRLVGADVVLIEIAGDAEQQRRALLVPDESRARRPARFIGREARLLERRLQLRGLEQRLALAGGGIDLQPLGGGAPAATAFAFALRVDEVRVA